MNYLQLVREFSVHDKDGNFLLNQDRVRWASQHGGLGFGPIVKYSWNVDGVEFSSPANLMKSTWYVLPNASGFICFENESTPNNCTLLNACGQEFLRLQVPWQLTAVNNPASNASPSHFIGVSLPYPHAADGTLGQFGVEAWVELAGEYYFELDWRTGEFLWGREIRF